MTGIPRMDYAMYLANLVQTVHAYQAPDRERPLAGSRRLRRCDGPSALNRGSPDLAVGTR
jgi:hypothetical protein